MLTSSTTTTVYSSQSNVALISSTQRKRFAVLQICSLITNSVNNRLRYWRHWLAVTFLSVYQYCFHVHGDLSLRLFLHYKLLTYSQSTLRPQADSPQNHGFPCVLQVDMYVLIHLWQGIGSNTLQTESLRKVWGKSVYLSVKVQEANQVSRNQSVDFRLEVTLENKTQVK